MRVTFVVANYAPSLGGSQVLVQHIAEGLAGLGHSVTVVTTDAVLSPGARNPGTTSVGDEVLKGVVVKRRPVARRVHRVVRTLRKVLARLRARRILAWTAPLAAGPIGFRLALEIRRAARVDDVVVGVAAPYLTVPMVDLMTRRGTARAAYLPLLHLSASDPRSSVLRALRRAACVVGLTEFERHWLVENGVDGRRVEAIPPGCEVGDGIVASPSSARSQLGLPERLTVGYVGRMAGYKGIATLLQAMELLWERRPEINLLLAGGGAGWSAFDGLLEQTRQVAGDRLVYLGAFDDAEKRLLYQACDVIASPSREESFGITTIEAWAAGRPMVAGDIDVVRSLIRPGEDGELVPVDDADAWAAALEELLDDNDLRTRLGSAGHERVEQEFTWPVVIRQWDELLRRSVGESVGSNNVDSR